MRIFFSIDLLIKVATILVLSSCLPVRNVDLNQKFESRYGDQVNAINKNRVMQDQDFSESRQFENTNFNNDPNYKLYSKPSQILSTISPINEPAEFETHKLFLKRPEVFLPTKQTYEIGIRNSAAAMIPKDIFQITYNTSQHPPFQVTGIDFDIIVIPKKDAYGVSSSLDEKSYPIASNHYVSRNINSMINNRSNEDIEFTEDLIAEQKLIRKQVAVNNLYQSDHVEEDKTSFDYDNSQEEWSVAKRNIREEPLQKIIGSQVVSKNLKTNYLIQQNTAQQNAATKKDGANAGKRTTQTNTR